MRAVKCLSVGRAKLLILHCQIANWVHSKNDRVEQPSASPGAVESMRYPPGDELNHWSETVLAITFGFACVLCVGILRATFRESVDASEPQRAALYTRLAFLRGEDWMDGGSVSGLPSMLELARWLITSTREQHTGSRRRSFQVAHHV
jgi:hypothetical protein